jgi:hypothetical protein
VIKTYAIVGSAKLVANLNEQYSDLNNALKNLEFKDSEVADCDYLIFVNYNKKILRRFKKLKKTGTKLVLIRLEPIAVLPIQYTKKVEKIFDLIISPGRKIAADNKSEFIGWPYRYNFNPSKPNTERIQVENIVNQSVRDGFFEYKQWALRDNALVLIAANKVSPTKNSNYRIRRQIAQLMDKSELNVYGALWNDTKLQLLIHRIRTFLFAFRTGYIPNISEIYGRFFTRYSNFVSEPLNKHEVNRKYKFSLVIENSNYYCSEKLFDAMINGSIPIYIGPKNYEINLPDNLYLSCDGSVSEIRNLIANLSQRQCSDMLNSMKVFLQSNDFLIGWQSEEIYRKIAEKIKELG